MDVMDAHMYWQAIFREVTFPNTPQLDAPDASMPAMLSRTGVKGKPFIVSELNEAFPNDHACEMFPLVAAYASLQEWDGIFWHSWNDGHHDWEQMFPFQAITQHLRIGSDPMKMSQFAAGALTFLRGDVQAARTTVERRMPYDFVLESLRTKSAEVNRSPYWISYLPGRLGLVHRTVIADFHAPALSPAEGEVALPAGTIVSDTGELTWETAPQDGRLCVDTPRTQCVIGRAGVRATSNLTVALTTRFAAVQLTSLEARPIAEAETLLLVAAARVANTGMRWTDETRTSLGNRTIWENSAWDSPRAAHLLPPPLNDNWGEPPTRIEPVEASLTLHGLKGAKAVYLQPLDGCGQPWGEPRCAMTCADGFVIELTADPGTTWYVVRVER